MKQETITGIRTFLAADETVPKDKIETVVRTFLVVQDEPSGLRSIIVFVLPLILVLR